MTGASLATLAGHTVVAALPPLDWSHMGITEVGAVPTFLMVVALGCYLWGVQRVRARPGGTWSVGRTVAFVAGMVVTAFAIESFIGAYDDTLFYDHMVQHLLLVMIAGPLFALGAPLDLLVEATGGESHRLVERAMRSRVAEVAGHPITGFVLYFAFIPIAHLTSFYNWTLEYEPVHDLEHILFLVIGYLFFRPVVAIEASRHRLIPPLQLLYVALAVPVDTFTGLALTSTTHELFPYYLAHPRSWGPSLLTDVHAGGAIMWVGGDSLMFLIMIPIVLRWVRYEDARTAELDAELDAELAASGTLPGDPN